MLKRGPCIQVLWLGRPEIQATWKPAKSLPEGLVREFEAGVEAEVTIDKHAIYGHISGTLNVSHCSEDRRKKVKLERPCHADSEGCVVTLCNHFHNVFLHPLVHFKRALIHQCLL